ncbi:MAG: hypothetical protein ACREGA_04000 [Candidatus Saccharimonadales bacterium]
MPPNEQNSNNEPPALPAPVSSGATPPDNGSNPAETPQTFASQQAAFAQSSQPQQPVPQGPVPGAQPSIAQNPPPDQSPPRPIDTFGQPDLYKLQHLPKHGKSPLLALLIVVVLVIVIGGGAFALFHSKQPAPNEVFQDAVASALSTSQLAQQTVVTGTSNATESTRYDLADMKNPKVSTDTSVTPSKTYGLQYKGYATLSDSYLILESAGVKGQSSGQSASQPKKWLQVRRGNSLSSVIKGGSIPDPAVELFGDFIFGNFPAKQRSQLVAYTINNNIYQYDADKVAKSTLNGQPVFVYDITENVPKLKLLNQKAAADMGMNSDLYKTLFTAAGADYAKTGKLYISVKQHRLLKVVTKSGGSTGTTTYKYDNLPAMPPQPAHAAPEYKS